MLFPYRIHDYMRAMRGKKSDKFGGLISARKQKEYPRMARIPLPMPKLPMPLGEALATRTSVNSFDTTASIISSHDIGAVLGHALRAREDGTRPYPSGGGYYPIETYLIANRVKDLSGIYHYQPQAHALEYLWDMPGDITLFENAGGWANEAGATIIFTGMWGRAYEKYGDFSYLLGILEAGHMAQNVLLAAASVGLACCPMEGYGDAQLLETLDINPRLEQSVYTIVLGKKWNPPGLTGSKT